HYPDAAGAANPYRALLDLVISAQANLIAKCLLVRLIHGVMNTDNMTISGETIDYGPCAFMDTYDPDTVYSSIDEAGRYAYGNQLRMAHWNLARFAEALVPLLGEDKDAGLKEAQDAIDAFVPQHEAAYSAGLSCKLGLRQQRPENLALAQELLDQMATSGLDFTGTFRALSEAAASSDHEAVLRSRFADPGEFEDWVVKWRRRLDEEVGDADNIRAVMAKTNPIFIPRNHLVEEAISAAENDDDFSRFDTLMSVLAKPFEDQPSHSRYAEPPTPDQVVHQTFCGT
ncbi:MAG: protein adenylyltransferase SelO family protein, partial [Micropepsaceae bacterium]